MKQIRVNLSKALRVLSAIAASALIVAPIAAHADEYTDVNKLITQGNLSEANIKIEQYLVGKPKDPQMRFLKGVVQTDSGRTQDAVATFTQLTQDYPEIPEPYNNLAVLYSNQGQYDKARVALEMAIRTNPNYAVAHENLGDIYARLAAESYQRAQKLDANIPTIAPKLTIIRSVFAQPVKPKTPARKG